MKRLYKTTKISLLLCLLGITQAFARTAPVAVVESLVGNVFVMTPSGAKKLKAGDHLEDLSELRTTLGAQVTFSDYYDHRFHLAGSGHVKLNGELLELRQGYLWMQSHNKDYTPFMIQTANALMTYKTGEAIISFDNYSGQSQLLVIKDHVEFANVLERERSYVIQEGSFSYVHKDYEGGTPRHPTPIGFKSYEKVTSLFENVVPLDKNNRYELQMQKTAPSRGIASVSSSTPAVMYVKKKERTVLTSKKAMKYHERKIASILKPAKKKVKKKTFSPDYSKRSQVTVRVFGAPRELNLRKPTSMKPMVENKEPVMAHSSTKPIIKVIGARQPASVEPFEPTRVPASVNTGDVFERSLIRQYKQQQRHSKEVNSLINDLQNYDQDFQTSY